MKLKCFLCSNELEFSSRKRSKAISKAGWDHRGPRFYCTSCKGEPPQRVQAVINKVLGGQILAKWGGGDETVYQLLPSCKRVGPETAKAVIASGKLSPRLDGLFGPETSQTWEAIRHA